MNLGKRIKKARFRAGLSQKEVAQKSGVSVSFLSQVEKGKVSPSLKSLQNIVQALDIKVNQLLDEDTSASRKIKVIKKNTNEKIILENGESLGFYLD